MKENKPLIAKTKFTSDMSIKCIWGCVSVLHVFGEVSLLEKKILNRLSKCSW